MFELEYVDGPLDEKDSFEILPGSYFSASIQ